MLEIQNLAVNYGPIEAVKGINLSVTQGEIVALIGSNGAGKTSTLQAISGLVRKRAGRVTFNGRDITATAPHEIVKLGLTQVPQGRQVFPDQSVEDNLRLGAFTLARDPTIVRQRMEREYSRFPRLAERRRQMAGTLSGGEQQMLAVSRSLMVDPQFLCLDEPSLGLAPLIVQEIARTIQQLNTQGVTVLLVEQLATMALSIAHRGYVLQTGDIRLTGTGKELLSHPEVIRAYLGG